MTYGIIIRNGFNRKSCSGDRSGLFLTTTKNTTITA